MDFQFSAIHPAFQDFEKEVAEEDTVAFPPMVLDVPPPASFPTEEVALFATDVVEEEEANVAELSELVLADKLEAVAGAAAAIVDEEAEAAEEACVFLSWPAAWSSHQNA